MRLPGAEATTGLAIENSRRRRARGSDGRYPSRPFIFHLWSENLRVDELSQQLGEGLPQGRPVQVGMSLCFGDISGALQRPYLAGAFGAEPGQLVHLEQRPRPTGRDGPAPRSHMRPLMTILDRNW